MEWDDNLRRREPGGGSYEGSVLLNYFAEADGVDFASEDAMPLHDLMYLQRSILGTGIARRLYEEYPDCVQHPISRDDYSVLDLDIVPSFDSSAENAMVSDVTNNAYIVNDGYSEYSIRMLSKKVRVKGQRRTYLMERIEYLSLKDRFDDTSLVEFFLNPDLSPDQALDIQIMINGWQEPRKPANALQKVILARTIEALLDPENPERLVQYDHDASETDEGTDTTSDI